MHNIETFDSNRGHNFLTKDKTERTTAQDAMRRAGALFEVAYLPSAFYRKDLDTFSYPRIGSGVNEGKPRHKYVVRTDTHEVLGLHSHTYAETDGYEFIADMAETMFPESATSCTVFGAGEKIALTQDLIDPIDIGNGDVIQPQICWLTSFNGVWPTAVYDLNHRLFCQNQLVGTPLVRVKHTKNHDTLLEYRIQILEGARERADTLAAMARVLRDQEYTDEQFKELVEGLLPINWEEDAGKRKVDNIITKRAACGAAWRKEKEEWGDGNRWLAYNAVQGAEQHNINGRVRGGYYSRDRALEKAIDNHTPLAERAMTLLAV